MTYFCCNNKWTSEFDPAKSARNAAERDSPFDLVAEVEWEYAIVAVDGRLDYGEERFIALAPRDGRLHVICYVVRGSSRRIISFRKANDREQEIYREAVAHRRRR